MSTPEALPALPAGVTDPVTARMCIETGHSCIACPSDARNLAATAHNAHGAVTAALAGHGGWDRAWRKLGGLRDALDTFQKATDTHFAALAEWERPRGVSPLAQLPHEHGPGRDAGG